jgi:septal ring factor EnvC (AmiA/AmiB activator)
MIFISRKNKTQHQAPLGAVLLLLFGLLSILPMVSNAAESVRSKEKKQAEAARSELLQKLKALKKDIGKTELVKEHASDALEDSEQAISETNRSLRNLKIEQAQAEARLNQLIAEQAILNAQVEKQKKQLSEFLRRQYVHGDNDRLKLLLSGDNPNRINRELHYMSYISQTQAKMIAALRISVAEIEKNKLAAQEAKDALDEIAQEERDHKKGLEKEKSRRAIVLSDIAIKLRAQRKEADNLQKDEQRLNGLVSRLSKMIEEQAKAEAKAEQVRIALLEKQRKEKLAAEKLQQEKNQVASHGKKTDKVEPTVARSEETVKATQIVQTPSLGMNDGLAFGRLKGQLLLPTKGELTAKFGTKRDGPSWKGLFIKAIEGAEIKAIAAGKVVVAEWMRGYGNIIILSHGGDYLSLYSNNQALLKLVGDTVKAGEVIAGAGNTGGNEATGLYFEMRYQGKPFDPLLWMKK